MVALSNNQILLPLSFSTATSREFNHLAGFSYIRRRAWKLRSAPQQYNSSSPRCRIKRSQLVSAKNYEAGPLEDAEEIVHKDSDDLTCSLEDKNVRTGSSFLAKMAIALGIAATITFLSIGFKHPNQGSNFGIQYLVDGSSSSTMSTPAPGFSFKAFGYRVMLPEYAPGWLYFWLLMAAGFGLFISEEALNIWVGISLARMLVLDGTWQSLVSSFSRNAPYITSTILWVYWGVCISDMIPFYLGKLFKQSGASDDVCSKLGIGNQKARDITNAVQKYGNLIGFGELQQSRTFFSWSEKSHRFPCRGSGYITRVFLCRCLLWWLDNSSNSVDHWIFTKRASSICSCNRCYCSGNLDCIPLCSGYFYSIIPISTSIFWLGQLITFMNGSQVVRMWRRVLIQAWMDIFITC